MCKKYEDFANLHNHSYFSPLDGYGSPGAMASRAIELNQPALALTDHGSLSGVLSFKKACEAANVKPIIGCEFYIVPWGRDLSWRRDDGRRTGTAYHLTTWAYNQTGYQNMLKLTKLANEVGFFHVPRIDYDMLEKHSEGLITTTGCMAGNIPSLLNPEHGIQYEAYRTVNTIIDFMVSVFGRDRYYIELQGHDIPALRDINVELNRINDYYKLDYVATNDSHYPRPEDNIGQVEVMCVSQNCSVYAPNEFIRNTFVGKKYYMPGLDEIKTYNFGFPVPHSAFTNTIKIVEMIEDIKIGYEPEVKRYKFPVLPEYSDDYDYKLNLLAENMFLKRYHSIHNFYDTARSRLLYELNTVNNLGFSSYFLCLYDIKKFCDDNGIPMTVRGSAGGSIILYCLGITDFDPLEYGLLFERFLNPDRISAPDADLDVDPKYRAMVVEYLVGKYGQDYVAQVVNFNFIKSKSAVKDATRIHDAPYSVGEDIILMSESGDNDFNDLQLSILETASRLEGQIRTMGLHAGAVILSDEPLVNDYPLVRPKSGSKAITNLLVGFNYEMAEDVGGIKLDILGVDALGILYEAMKLVNDRHGTNYTFENTPVNDSAAYDIINSGELAEIFQLSGRTAEHVCAAIKPRSVEDIMIVTSLARPGPLQYAGLYVSRRNGDTPVEYLHPDLEIVLNTTEGIIIFQEQAMKISQIVAGFTGSEADTLRKAISKKKGIEKVLGKLKAKALDRGYSEDFIDQLCSDLIEFGAYCFNASHACAYSRIGAKQAYFKAHYPIEYYTAALTGRSSDQDKLIPILKELRQVGIKLTPPKLGKSHPTEFVIGDDNKSVLYPLCAVKNVGKGAYYIKDIKAENYNELTFADYKNFKKAGLRAIQSLALVGALDHLFNGDRNKAVEFAPYLSKGVPPFKQASFINDNLDRPLSYYLANERELTGYYLTGHPLDNHIIDQPSFNDLDIFIQLEGETLFIVGLISKVKLHRDRKGNIMAFLDIEDIDYNKLNVVIFASLYEDVHEFVKEGKVIKIIGDVSIK